MSTRPRLKHGWLSPAFATIGVVSAIAAFVTITAMSDTPDANLVKLLAQMLSVASGFFAILGVAAVWAVPAASRRPRAIYAGAVVVATAVLLVLTWS